MKHELSEEAKKILNAKVAGARLKYDREYGQFNMTLPGGKVEVVSSIAVRELVNASRLKPSVFA